MREAGQPRRNLGLLERRAKAAITCAGVTASQGNNVNVITVNDQIFYFRAENKYTTVITADGEALIRRPIWELAEAVDPQRVLADPPLPRSSTSMPLRE